MSDEKEPSKISKYFGVYWQVVEVYFSIFGFVVHLAGVVLLIVLMVKFFMGVSSVGN